MSSTYPSSSYRRRRSSFQEFDVIPESLRRLHTPPLPSPVDEQSKQIKKLQMRKTHFQGKSIPSQSSSPTSTAWSRGIHSQSIGRSGISSSQTSFENATQYSPENGILQEVSNSSLRRRRMRRCDDPSPRIHAASIFEPPSGPENTNYLDDFSPPVPHGSKTIDCIPRQRPLTKTGDRTADWILSESTLRSHGHIEFNPGPAARQQTPKANTSMNRRSMSGETSRYIEHLESQLVSAQAQLSSLMSPTTTRNHSSKLRAMNEEMKILKHEILEWESKFDERVQEQLEQQRSIASGLRTQIGILEKDAASSGEKVKMLQLECQEKGRKLEATEVANYSLERRLEFMSELLGTSPTKINLHADAPQQARRRSPVRARPLSMFSPRLPSGGGLFSPHPSKTFAQSQDPIASPGSPSPYKPWEQNPFDLIALEGRNDERPEEFVPDAPTMALVNHYETSSNRRESFIESRRDADGFVKPARRMRKFYSGSQGPKALILPATSNAVTLPTPTSMGPTPDLSFRGSYVWDVSAELPTPIDTNDQRSECSIVRPRSASWTKDTTGQLAHRKLSPIIPRNITQQSVPSRSYTTPFATTEGTTKSATNRIISMGSTNVTSLFEELSRMKQDCHSNVEGIVSLSPMVKRVTLRSSPSLSPAVRFNRSREVSSQCAMLLERESLAHKIARRGVMWPVRRPISFVGHVADHVSQTLDTSIQPARSVFSNAWSTLTLSRPAIEFRWWLIKLLLGDMKKKKGKLVQAERQLGLGLSLPSTPLMIKPSAQEDDELTNDCATQERKPTVRSESGATLLPTRTRAVSVMTWLKFSMTLVLAVGIALRDGPSALFTTAR